MCCQKHFYDKFIQSINQWKQDKIVAISILVYANENFTYKNIKKFFEISIGYISESSISDNYDIENGEYEWDLADIEGREVILDPENYNETAEIVLEWLISKGVKNIGTEDYEKSYDENMNYVGKGPNGYYEVLTMISEVARKLQLQGIIGEKFGKVPIIVHDLEYSWYSEDATILANPNNEAKDFIGYFRKNILN